jgi:putative sterol carrier protein
VEDSPVLQLTADEFAALVWAASDEQIEEGIRAAGTERVLNRIFDEMQHAFLPQRAPGVSTEVQWVVTDQGREHPYRMTIAEDICSTARGRTEHPKATLTTDTVTFAKLVTGRREGVQLWMLKKLQVKGDVMLAVRLNGYFQRPRPPQ